jgi:hypothetical protein
MKKYDYCGRANDDSAIACRECGSSDFASEHERVSVTESRKPEPDEISLAPIALKEGCAMTLKLRTPGEAYLVCDELEAADIVTILPEEEELRSQFEQNGYVEVRVSAKAYESLADLRSRVEFQYKRVRAEQPLSYSGKALGMICGVMIGPGMLAFACLLSSYRKNGYDRMAKDLKVWFLLGIGALLLVASSCAALGADGAPAADFFH